MRNDSGPSVLYATSMPRPVGIMRTKRAVTNEMIRAAVRILLDRETYAYTMLWESLTIPQKRFLKGLAAEAAGVKVFGGEFVSRYGLGSPSNAQRVVEA